MPLEGALQIADCRFLAWNDRAEVDIRTEYLIVEIFSLEIGSRYRQNVPLEAAVQIEKSSSFFQIAD